MTSLADLERYVAGLSAQEKRELDIMIKPELDARASIARLRELRNWSPREYQEPLWDYLQSGGKRACVIWHRRSGKDDVALNWTAEAAHERVGEYWHMLPEAAQARRAIWDAVNPHTGRKRIDQAFPAEMRANTRKQDMVIEFKNGSLWRVVGSDNYDSLVGSTPAGIVFSEWALADPNAWAFIRPIVVENNGWAIFITTPRGTNHAKTTLDIAKNDEEWFGQVLSATETGVFTEAQLAAELRDYQREYGREEGAALFEQEYNCSFESALIGSYYGAYLTQAAKAGRITSVPVDRAALVHTSWDLGVTDSTAIWFIQCVGKERRLIDYYEASGVGLQEYVQVLEARQKERGYTYGFHFFPHDVAVKELGNGALSRVDTLRGLGIKARVVPRHNLNDGINATRRLLDVAWADERLCERGLNALRNYRRQWNEKTKMFSDAPLHDWTSHAADALRTFAAGFREGRESPMPTAKIPDFAGMRGERSAGWMSR